MAIQQKLELFQQNLYGNELLYWNIFHIKHPTEDLPDRNWQF